MSTMVCGGDIWDTRNLGTISNEYTSELPADLGATVDAELQSPAFKAKLAKAIGRDAGKFVLKIEYKLEFGVPGAELGQMFLTATSEDLAKLDSDKVMKIVETYAKCRSRGCSEDYALAASFPVANQSEVRLTKSQSWIVRDYPWVVPGMLQPDPIRKKAVGSLESYVLKDLMFWWYFDLRKPIEGVKHRWHDERVPNPATNKPKGRL